MEIGLKKIKEADIEFHPPTHDDAGDNPEPRNYLTQRLFVNDNYWF